ncbi:MAG: ATP-binding protein [bacterium]|nr:ATP-binding protein [bacterium]
MLSVLTGSPYSGKTTIIETLPALGFATVAEVAIDLIKKREALGEVHQPSRDRTTFQLAVMRRQVDHYLRLADRRTFFDRGIPDGIGYFIADGLPVPDALLRASAAHRYQRVFFLEALEWPSADRWREENPESQRKIEQGIREAYTRLGYRMIPIPALGVRDRRELILSYL